MNATEKRKITIFCNGVWAGTGTIDDDGHIGDCSAVLGKDQDESDQTYENLELAIEDDDEVCVLSYGIFTWEIEE